MDYIIGNFLGSVKWTLLEIIPPRDIEKSPQPMESFFAGLTGITSALSAKDEFIDGKVILKFSFELVSDEGIVHIYIRTPTMFRNLVEAGIYAQYPNAEILEVSDYVNDVPKVIPNKDWDLWGTDFELTKPDPYPIRSYRRFEEDVTGKMIDPLSSVFESLTKVGPNQKLWYQIIIKPKDIFLYETSQKLIEEKFKGKVPAKNGILANFLADIGDVFGNLFAGLTGPVEFAKKEAEKEEAPLEFRLTPGEKDVLKAIEDSAGKPVFETKMRLVYIGKREFFDRSNIASFIGSLWQFSDFNFNGFKPNAETKTFALHLWVKQRTLFRQRRIYRLYKERNNDPSEAGPNIFLNTEELATIFHLPDQMVIAPTLRKVEYKKSIVPPGLPV